MGWMNERDMRWRGRHLRSVNAFKILCHMAFVSMDGDERPYYNGGWERLALACGYDVGRVVGHPRGPHKTAVNAVNKACGQLADEGLIRLVESGAPGRNAKWELLLTEVIPENLGNEPVDNSVAGDAGEGGFVPGVFGNERSREPMPIIPENPGQTFPKTSGTEKSIRKAREDQDEENRLASQPELSSRDGRPVDKAEAVAATDDEGEGDVAHAPVTGVALVRHHLQLVRGGNAGALHVKEQ